MAHIPVAEVAFANFLSLTESAARLVRNVPHSTGQDQGEFCGTNTAINTRIRFRGREGAQERASLEYIFREGTRCN